MSQKCNNTIEAANQTGVCSSCAVPLLLEYDRFSHDIAHIIQTNITARQLFQWSRTLEDTPLK